MDFLKIDITKWFREILADRILYEVYKLNDVMASGITDSAGSLSENLSTYPGALSLIETLNKDVFIPLGIAVLAVVLCYELIDMFISQNNMNEVDTFVFFKWILKAYIGIVIVTHGFDIVNGIYEVGVNLVNNVSTGFTSATSSPAFTTTKEALVDLGSVGVLISILLQLKLSKIVFIVLRLWMLYAIYSRLFQMYLYASVAAIPLSTIVNKEWGQTSNNYLRSIMSLALSGAIMMLVLAIYRAMVSSLTFGTSTLNEDILSGNAFSPFLKLIVYSVAAAVMMKQSKTITDSVMNAH